MLPVIDNRPIEEVKLPESKQLIKIKGYKTSQEKVLLQSLIDEKQRKSWLNNIKQIIKDNTLDVLEIDKMSSLDFLFLCLKLRAISKGQLFEYSFRCMGVINEAPCSHLFEEADPIDALINIKNADKTKILCELHPSLTIELKPASIQYYDYLAGLAEEDYEKELTELDGEKIVANENLTLFYNQIAYCVSKVIVTENGKPHIYTDFTIDELKENILLNLTIADLQKLAEHKKKLISMAIRIRKVCPKCGQVFEKEETNFFEYVA